MNYAKEKVDIERTIYTWAIPDFTDLFQDLNQRKNVARSNRRNNGKEKPDSSDLEIVSETFMRGQLVHRTSIWQLELRRNGTFLCVGLSCLECFHENIDEIWTRFDIDIVDFNGIVCYSQGAGAHFCSDNITKFTPLKRIGDKAEARSFWETDAISMNDLQKNWEKLVRMNILSLRLRLYIYPEKPVDEASLFAEYHEPVKLCFTDNHQSLITNPFLGAVKILWESREDADVTFKVQGEEIKAHKLIIAVQSPVLKMMTSNIKENSTIEINDTSSQIFQQVLKFLYTQDASDVKSSSDIDYITSVLDASNNFEITSLVRVCLVRLLTNMSVENFADTAFAVYSRVTREQSFFKTEVKKFLMENQRELVKSETFQKKCRDKDFKEHFLQLCFEPLPLLRNHSTVTATQTPSN